MTAFPASPDEFYALRDDRTNLCQVDRRYQKSECTVVISESAAETVAGQATLFAACNMLSRWCRRVTIVMPTLADNHRFGGQFPTVGESILRQMRDADPFGQFEISAERKEIGPHSIILHIGDAAEAGQKAREVFVNASGWLAGISRSSNPPLSPNGDGNPLGSIAAACLGVAQVFKIAVGHKEEDLLDDGVFDLFNFTYDRTGMCSHHQCPAHSNIGRILMVGAGSVGSAAAYCLRAAEVSAEIVVVDKDDVKIENFNRSPIFGKSSAGLNKAQAIAAYLAGTSINANAYPGWWDEYVRERDRPSFGFDVWLPLANDHGVRWAMQNNVPPLMIHASTTSNWGVNHARHIPGRDDCLADRFPGVVEKESLACGIGEIKTQGVSVDAALPFASMFAGLLIVADLIRAQVPGYPQVPNFALFDFRSGFRNTHIWNKKPREGCICKSQKSLQYLNKDTRYWSLFNLR